MLDPNGLIGKEIRIVRHRLGKSDIVHSGVLVSVSKFELRIEGKYNHGIWVSTPHPTFGFVEVLG